MEKLLQDKRRAMWKQNPWGELQLSRVTKERNSARRRWAALLSGADVTPPALAAYEELRIVSQRKLRDRQAFWCSWLEAQGPRVPGVPGEPGLVLPGIDVAVKPLEPMLDPYALAFELRPGIWLLDTASWPEWLKLGFCPASLANTLAWSPAGQGEAGAVPAGCQAPDTGGSGSLPYFRPALPWQ